MELGKRYIAILNFSGKSVSVICITQTHRFKNVL